MSNKPHRLFVLAGEPSGDRLAAALLDDLAKSAIIEATGVGGNCMLAQGFQTLFPMDELSVMGFADVVKRLPRLLWRIGQLARYIMRTNPDAVLLVDSQVFSSLLAQKLRKKGYKKPIILYVAPSVWAWKPERAPALKPLFDEILAILPFEPDVMVRLGGPATSYVGHPALLSATKGGEGGQIALLPGSRLGEIKRHMPLLKAVVAELADEQGVKGFVMPTLPHLAQQLANETANWAAPIKIVADKQSRDAALAETTLAIVTAGTITLELALANIAMVGTYVPDKRLMHHYEKAGRPMIALPNIVLHRRVVPEIPPGPNMTAELVEAVRQHWRQPELRATQISEFAEMRRLMIEGDGSDVHNAAARVLAHLKK